MGVPAELGTAATTDVIANESLDTGAVARTETGALELLERDRSALNRPGSRAGSVVFTAATSAHTALRTRRKNR